MKFLDYYVDNICFFKFVIYIHHILMWGGERHNISKLIIRDIMTKMAAVCVHASTIKCERSAMHAPRMTYIRSCVVKLKRRRVQWQRKHREIASVGDGGWRGNTILLSKGKFI
jgi:hypothetical protein